MMWISKEKSDALYRAMHTHAAAILENNRELRKQIAELRFDLKLLMDHQGLYVRRVDAYSVILVKETPPPKYTK